tara:strand:- start:97 stop:681 length:585 start_codon:yes stop_codon:yes gene_type:complete
MSLDEKNKTSEIKIKIDDLNNEIKQNSDSLNDFKDFLQSNFDRLFKSNDDMVKTFLNMQNKLNEQDEEIKKLRKGYETQIFSKFLMRFIRVKQIINDNYKKSSLDTNFIDRLILRFNDALEECNVTVFKPKLGENINTFKHDDFEIINVITENQEKDDTITEIIDEGYKLNKLNNEYEILIKPKIKVLKYSKEK